MAMGLDQLQHEVLPHQQAVAEGQPPQDNLRRPPTYDQASFKHVFPFDILSSIIAYCSGDRKALLALALTSKDCSHEATKLLWAFHMRISAPDLDCMMRLSSFIVSNPRKALYIRQIHVFVSNKSDRISRALRSLFQPVPGRINSEDWRNASLEAALGALCDALSCMHNLVSLRIEVDEFFREAATALSTAAEMGRLAFRLNTLETNLFAADGFAGFLHTQPNIEKLTQHWRRDRFLNEPGTLSATTLSTNPNADTGAGAGGDSAIGDSISASSVPRSSFTLASNGVPLLPNLRRLQHAPRGMAEVTRDRPVESIVTTLREVRDVNDLFQALEASQVTVTRLKVGVEAAEVLRPFLEGLSHMRPGRGAGPSSSASPLSGGTLALASKIDTQRQELQVGNGIEHLSIAVQAHRDASPLSLLEQPAEQVHELLSNLRNGFPRLHTLRWDGPLVPKAARYPELYAGPALRTVLIESLGFPGSTYIRVFDGCRHKGENGGRWEKIEAPKLKADGSRRRQVFQTIGTHDIVDADEVS